MEIVKVRILLSIEAEEARWLKGIMQNPLHGVTDPDKEDEYDKRMRRKYFEILDAHV